MSNDKQTTDQWDTCSAGELTNMVNRLDARQRSVRRKQVLGTALASTGVFACLVLALGSWMNSGANHYGGIACSVCRDHLAEYQLHLVGDSKLEDAQMLASVKTHLEKCSFCRSKFNSLYPDQRIGSLGGQRATLLVAMQPTFTWHQGQTTY